VTEFASLLDRARDLADDFALTAVQHDRLAELPAANFRSLHRAGLLGLTTAREHGGFGGGLVAAQAVVSEIARGEPSTALVLAMHLNNHSVIARSRSWPTHLVDRVTRANRQRVALINSAQVEPRIGSPSHGRLPETVARRDGSKWRVTGHKRYATGSALLTWATVLAVTDEPEPRLALFLVPLDAPGVRIVQTWDATGLRASSSHDLVLEDVVVPVEDIIDPRPAADGLVRDPTGMYWYFTLIASVYDGVARAAGAWLTRFASDYAPGSLGSPIATLPRLQDGIGDIEIRLGVNRRLLRSVAEEADAGRSDGLEAAFVKHVVIENAIAVTALALDLAGNPGLSRDNPLERHHRDALCGRAHAPQNNMIRVMAAKAALAGLGDDQSVPPSKPQLAVVGGALAAKS
jgi:alkylation response protein AidB-like acyl-CoA dehydrogenase